MNALHSLLRLGSLTLLTALLCLPVHAAAPKEKPGDEHHDHKHESGHKHNPLMGGELIEIGDHQFNLELKFDPTRGILLAWILDAHAENFVRITALSFEIQEEDGEKRSITLRAVANDLTGEKPGDSSAFEGEAKWLGALKHFDGRIRSLTIRGVEFRDIDLHFHP